MLNEKIKELAKKSGATFLQSSDGKVEYVDYNQTFFDMEKFAKLIIQECIDIFEPPKIDDPKWSYDHSMLCMDIQDKIKQHFGIKE